MTRGENALVRWLRQRLVPDARRVPIGIGDDMAAVRLDGSLVTITADMLLDGVHFETSRHDYQAIGYKAIACSLSDCAGMGCEPRAAIVSVALNREMVIEDVQQLYEGMSAVAESFGCAIVGGDTTSWPSPLAIDVAMLAEPMNPRGPIPRSGAMCGDTIFVSGSLGGSLAGKHLEFTPRLALARRLADEPGLHAMMDITDGLSMDLDRLCEASSCGAELVAKQLECVISDAARTMSKEDGRPTLEHAFSDGEDFELLVVGDESLKAEDLGLHPVGRILERGASSDTAMWFIDAAGTSRPLEPYGFEHFT